MKLDNILRFQSYTKSNFAKLDTKISGFGVPRDIIDKVKADNLQEITDAEKIKNLKQSTWLQSGTNKFASQKGLTGMNKFHSY